MSNLIYKNSDRRSADVEDSTNTYEDIYVNEDEIKMKEPTSKEMTSEPNSSGSRCYRLAVVCLMMLVVLLLAAIAILWFKLTTKDQIQTSCKSVAEERDQLQKKTDELQQKFSQLKKDIDTPKWLYFNSSIYYISNEMKSWNESRKDCQERGADLVIINSSDEQDLVGMWRRENAVWIGANDIETEEVWKWVDGTVISSGFWQTGEPNNVRNSEDCAVSGYRTERENWYDDSCEKEYIWICEKKINM